MAGNLSAALALNASRPATFLASTPVERAYAAYARATPARHWLLLAIAVTHAALVALMMSVDMLPVPPQLAPLMVQLISPPPPASKAPPKRTQAEPRKTLPIPVLNLQIPAPKADTPPQVAESTISREMAPAVPSVAVTTTISLPRFDASYLNNPAPPYPPLSRRSGEQGTVLLRVFVAPSGLPTQIEIKTGSGSLRLDQAAQDAVWRWKFVPAQRGDEAVGAWVIVPVAFSLRG